jgi:hypothetical protein
MTTLTAMAVVALLFMVFGMLRLRSASDCPGGSCASCGAICHLKGNEGAVRTGSGLIEPEDEQQPSVGGSYAE